MNRVSRNFFQHHRFTGLNKVINVAVTLALFANSAQALELGQAKLLSHLNEPLKANIAIGSVKSGDLADLHFSLADQRAYRAQGLAKPFYLGKLKFRLMQTAPKEHFVQLTTATRIREPIVDLFVKVEGKQGSLTRLYTLMLDPRDSVAAAPIKPIVVDSSVASKTPQPPVTPKKAMASAPTTTAASSRTEQQTLLVGRDSISIIAQNSALHEKYSVYQIMRAFYLLNKSAFIAGNINHLQAGSRLIVPDEKWVAEVPRQQAVNFVYAASSDHPFNKKPKPAKARPQLARTELDANISTTGSASSTKVTKMAQPSQSEAPGLSDAIRKDVADWRNMADEFSNLSFIVQTQNKVLKTHTSALKQLDANLGQQSTQLKDFGQRLQQLETGRLPAAVRDSDIALKRESLPPLELGDVKQEVAHTRDLIEGLNQRLQTLEQKNMPVVTSAETHKAVDSAVPGAATVTESAASSLHLETLFSAKWPIVLFSLGALLLLFVREWMWRRRIKTMVLDQAQKLYEKHQTESQDVAATSSTDDDQETVATETQESIASTAETSLQLADEKLDQAMAMARDFKLDPESTQEVLAEDSDDEALYAEIDILIAYQLYDEALNMVQSARANKPNNHCLDIRELEILAYTGKNDLFLRKYAEQKAFLEKEFPEAWEKIETLHNEMDTYPRAVTF